MIYSKTDETNNINKNIFLLENVMNQPTPQKNKDIQQTSSSEKGSVQKKLFWMKFLAHAQKFDRGGDTVQPTVKRP